MVRDLSQQAYCQTVGASSTNFAVIDQRDPTANDIYYPLGKFWINQTGKRLWYLNSQSNASGMLQSTWELISVSTILASLSDTSNTVVFPSSSSATPPDNIQLVGGIGITVVSTPGSNLLTITNTGTSSTETLTGDDGVAVSPSGGTIQTLGNTVANSTHAKPLYTTNSSGNIEQWDIQVAAAISSTNINKTGLSSYNSTQFSVDSNGFVTLAGGTGPSVLTVTGDTGGAVSPNSSGNLNWDGATTTYVTGTPSTHTLKTEVVSTLNTFLLGQGATTASTTIGPLINGQLIIGSTSAAPVAATLTAGTGISITNGAGSITIATSSAAGIQTLTGNSGGAISPTAGNINTLGTGSITIVGSGSTLTTELTGLTQYDVLVGQGSATIGLITPTATSGIPLISQGSSAYPIFGTAVVAGGGTGVTSLTPYALITGGTTSTGNVQQVSGLGTSTQVLTSNGASALPSWQNASASGAVTQFTLDAGTTPITPSAGNIVITGAQVATGVVGTNVIRSDGTSSNTCSIQIQRTTTSSVSNIALNGVCHFSSTNFTVDANGFVQFVGGSSSFPWTDEGGNFNAASNNGYFCIAALTATLPPTPAQGDIIRIVVDTTSSITIQANTGQKIRVGNVIGASAGSAISTKQGDAIDLVYRAASATWYAFDNPAGDWGIS